MTDQIPPDMVSAFLTAHSPLARIGGQEELDAALVFLASPASSYITGVTLPVDGGVSMR